MIISIIIHKFVGSKGASDHRECPLEQRSEIECDDLETC
jgi:hypothetical protein